MTLMGDNMSIIYCWTAVSGFLHTDPDVTLFTRWEVNVLLTSSELSVSQSVPWWWWWLLCRFPEKRRLGDFVSLLWWQQTWTPAVPGKLTRPDKRRNRNILCDPEEGGAIGAHSPIHLPCKKLNPAHGLGCHSLLSFNVSNVYSLRLDEHRSALIIY